MFTFFCHYDRTKLSLDFRAVGDIFISKGQGEVGIHRMGRGAREGLPELKQLCEKKKKKWAAMKIISPS